jgi:hypothetical protein
LAWGKNEKNYKSQKVVEAADKEERAGGSCITRKILRNRSDSVAQDKRNGEEFQEAACS